jgi:hypothetical protein
MYVHELWIRIRTDLKCWIRIRTEANADPQHTPTNIIKLVFYFSHIVK